MEHAQQGGAGTVNGEGSATCTCIIQMQCQGDQEGIYDNYFHTYDAKIKGHVVCKQSATWLRTA